MRVWNAFTDDGNDQYDDVTDHHVGTFRTEGKALFSAALHAQKEYGILSLDWRWNTDWNRWEAYADVVAYVVVGEDVL